MSALVPQHAHVRNLFLRALGVIFLIAFWSLGSQVLLLNGSDGLLPAHEFLDALRDRISFAQLPTLFWLDASDAMLRLGCIAGAVLSFGLILDLAPLPCLVALWVLYLSYCSIGQDFLSFQWDNLLLETAFFALFLTPWRWRAKHAPEPSRVAVFLMVWLVVRLHLESGAAKLCSGDPSWWDLTAMTSYYETAPIPTRLAWFAHQMPPWAHKATSLVTLVLELGLPLLFFGPRRLKPLGFALAVALQAGIALTANYGFFNYLSIALCLFLLDDAHLEWCAARLGRHLTPRPALVLGRLRQGLFVGIASVLVTLSTIAFWPVVNHLVPLDALAPVVRVLYPFRSINRYHLFASMTGRRDEMLIDGSNDGSTWLPYEFRYKAGDPMRPPPWVAPHQPRVDFQLWFLALRPQLNEPYFARLLEHLLVDPGTVAALFATMPFGAQPPKWLRVSIDRYHFTSAEERRRTGAWWLRERVHTWPPFARADVRR